MPKIMYDEKQAKALQDISDGLETLRKIAEVQKRAARTNVTVSVSESPRKSVSVDVDGLTATKVAKALSGYAKDTARDITRLAKNYRIVLDDDEEKIVARAMSDAAISKIGEGAQDAAKRAGAATKENDLSAQRSKNEYDDLGERMPFEDLP